MVGRSVSVSNQSNSLEKRRELIGAGGGHGQRRGQDDTYISLAQVLERRLGGRRSGVGYGGLDELCLVVIEGAVDIVFWPRKSNLARGLVIP